MLTISFQHIELVRAIFIYYNVFQFHVPRSISFLSYRANTHTHSNTDTHTHRDSNENSIVAFSKNATIIKLWFLRYNAITMHFIFHFHCYEY